MKIEVSNGEIIDKLTILQIKLEHITDEEKRKNVQHEYDLLKTIASEILSPADELYQALYAINCQLWDIEDKIRAMERDKDFGKEFIETARSVYFSNDKRSEIKKQINLKTGSDLVEEKSHEQY